MIEVRNITKQYIKDAASIEAACLSTNWSENQIVDSVFGENSSGFNYIGAFYGEELAGICSYYIILDEIQIINIAVSESFRMRGIGKEMINYIKKSAESKSCKKILLEYDKKNKAAENFYTALGFKITGERRGFYKDSDAVLADLEI